MTLYVRAKSGELLIKQINAALDAVGGGGGVTDGDKGDVVVSGGGTVWSIDYAAVNATVAPAWANITGKPVGTLFGSATVTVNGFEDEETITATGVTGSSRIFLSLQSGADSDENVADMIDLAALSGTPGTGQITVKMAFREPTSGPILIYWSAI